MIENFNFLRFQSVDGNNWLKIVVKKYVISNSGLFAFRDSVERDRVSQSSDYLFFSIGES